MSAVMSSGSAPSNTSQASPLSKSVEHHIHIGAIVGGSIGSFTAICILFVVAIRVSRGYTKGISEGPTRATLECQATPYPVAISVLSESEDIAPPLYNCTCSQVEQSQPISNSREPPPYSLSEHGFYNQFNLETWLLGQRSQAPSSTTLPEYRTDPESL